MSSLNLRKIRKEVESHNIDRFSLILDRLGIQEETSTSKPLKRVALKAVLALCSFVFAAAASILYRNSLISLQDWAAEGLVTNFFYSEQCRNLLVIASLVFVFSAVFFSVQFVRDLKRLKK